ncbi:MAG: hypothetical protein Q9174_003763 [Haloplaca sp. 1 TL-2023]
MAEIIGGVSGVLAIVAAATKLAKNLNDVRESYKSVALNIQLAAIQLSTIRTALEDIAEWRIDSPDDSSASKRLDATLADSLKGCAVLITVIDSKLGEAGFTPGVKAKVKHLWLEDVLSGYMSNLDGQVRALQLLLTSFQCRTVTEQMNRLERAEARTVFERVRMDTETLTIGNKGLEDDAVSILSFDPSVRFDMDDILMQHPMYKATYGAQPRFKNRQTRPRTPSVASSLSKAEAHVPAPAIDTPAHGKIVPPGIVRDRIQEPGSRDDTQATQGALDAGEASRTTHPDPKDTPPLPKLSPPGRDPPAAPPQAMTNHQPVTSSPSSAVQTFRDQLQSAFDEPSSQAEREIPNVHVQTPHSDGEGSDIDEMITMLPLASHFDISRKPGGKSRTHRLSVDSRDQEGRTITPRGSRSSLSHTAPIVEPAPSFFGLSEDKPAQVASPPAMEDTVSTNGYTAESHLQESTTAAQSDVEYDESARSTHSRSVRSLKRQASTDSDLYTSSITGVKPMEGPPQATKTSSLATDKHEANFAGDQLSPPSLGDGATEDQASYSSGTHEDPFQDPRESHRSSPVLSARDPSILSAKVGSLHWTKTGTGSSDLGITVPKPGAPDIPVKAQTAPAAFVNGQASIEDASINEQDEARDLPSQDGAVFSSHHRSQLSHTTSAGSISRKEVGSSNRAQRSYSEQLGPRIILSEEPSPKPRDGQLLDSMKPPSRPPPIPPQQTHVSSIANQTASLSPTTSFDIDRRWSNGSAVPRHMQSGTQASSPVERDESINETLSTVSSSDRSDGQTISSQPTSASNTVATTLSHPPDSLRGQAQTDLLKLQQELTAAKSRGDVNAQKASLQQSADVIRKAYLSTSGAAYLEGRSGTQSGSPPKAKTNRTSLMPKKKSMSLLSMVNKKSRQTDLHEAARTGNIDSLEEVLVEKVNINARGDRLKTPQMEAAMRSHLHILQTLKELGADEFAVDATGRNVLHMAVVSNQPKAVSWLIEAYPPAAHDVPGRKSSRLAWATEAISGSRSSKILREASDAEGSRPLHIAAKLGLPDMVTLLLDRGSDPEAKDNWGRTPLVVASMINRVDVIDRLLYRNADVRAQDVQGMTALHWAARHNHSGVISRLLRHTSTGVATQGTYRSATHVWLKECYDQNGDLPIHAAARRGHLTPVQMLKGEGAISGLKTKHGESLLHIVALANHLDIARELISIDANVNPWAKPHSYHLRLWPDGDKQHQPKLLPLPYNIIPLHYACTQGYYEMSELLLEHGAWVNAAPDDDNHGKSPLMMAVESGSTNLVCLLLARGAKSNAAVPATLETALHMGVKRGDFDTVQELIRYGAKAAARTRDLKTAEEFIPKIKDSQKKMALEKYFGELSRQRYAKIKAQMAENLQAGRGPGAQPSLTPQATPTPGSGAFYATPSPGYGPFGYPLQVDPMNDAFPDAPPAYTPGSGASQRMINRPGVYRPEYR